MVLQIFLKLKGEELFELKRSVINLQVVEELLCLLDAEKSKSLQAEKVRQISMREGI